MGKYARYVIGGLIALVVIILILLFTTKKTNDNVTSQSIQNNTSTNQNTQSVNNSVLQTVSTSNNGKYLTDPNGRTLYTFGGDTTNTSNCTSSCLSSWPPYIDSGSTRGLPTDVGTITRTDNQKAQFTYKSKPLYYFISDSAQSASGDGLDGFNVARP